MLLYDAWHEEREKILEPNSQLKKRLPFGI